MAEIRHVAASNLKRQECRFKNEEMKQICSREMKPEAVVQGFRLSKWQQTQSILLCGWYCWVRWLLYWLFWHVTRHQEMLLFWSWSLSTTQSGCQMMMMPVSLSQSISPCYTGNIKKIGCFGLIQVIKPVEAKFVISGYKCRQTGLVIKGNLMLRYHKHTYFEMGVKLAGENSTQAIVIFRDVIPMQQQWPSSQWKLKFDNHRPQRESVFWS